MAIPPVSFLPGNEDGERAGVHRSPERLRLSSVDDSTDSSFEETEIGEDEEESEEEESEEEESEEEESEEEEEEEEEDLTVTMAPIGNNVITEGKSERLVSCSTSKSPQSIKLQSSDILDCPTCCEPLKTPIYQCNNGHLACLSCCTKLKNICSFCKSIIGDIRCRAMEKIIEATIVTCPNAIYGCKHTTTYGYQSSHHEKLCPFIQCSCPLPNCNYIGSYTNLKTHVRAAHTLDKINLTPFVFDTPITFVLSLGKKKMAIFQEEKEGDLIIVQVLRRMHGASVTVSCIAPMTQGICNLSCSLAKLNELNTLRLGLVVKKIQKVKENELTLDGFMLIPRYMLRNEDLKMQICIGRDHKYVHI